MTRAEEELVAATKLKVRTSDRQEHLAALVRAVEKLSEDAYDELSEEAYQWQSAAVAAMDAKKAIPDFEEDEDDEKGMGGDAYDEEQALASKSIEEDVEDELEAEGAVKERAPEDSEEASKTSDEPGEEDDEPIPVPVHGKKEDKPKPKPKKQSAKKTAVKKPEKKPTRYDHITGERDRYGVHVGTKRHEALRMYEKGATIKQIKDKLGDIILNILREQEKKGHLVEKLEGGIYKLTHKDDVKPKKGKNK